MTKKEKSAMLVQKYQRYFKCPLCHSPIHVFDFKSVKCPNNHTFDFARQGYINFTTQLVKSNYTKKLFDARNAIITKSNLYSSLHITLKNIIEKFISTSMDPLLLADMGCGEGSHLNSVLNHFKHTNVTGVGLDISKEGILTAAKNYAELIWFVGDLTQSPLANESFHVVLNILSPANYAEFKRILAPKGFVVKVIPRSDYLQQLREALFPADSDYDNADPTVLFQDHFRLIDSYQVRQIHTFNQTELTNLVQMTPLAWSANQADIDSFLDLDSSEITVDLDILVGQKK